MKPNNETDLFGMFNFAILLISVVVIIFVFTAVFPYMSAQQAPVCSSLHEIIQSVTPIYSTEDGTATEGNFFLGCGYINTYLVYFVYTGDDINGFKREMIRADNVVVFRDSVVPYMIKKTVYKMTVVDAMTQVKGCLSNDVIELHVPKNTLIKDV
jgi:hypothetical protein